jgi:hypothetical protein
MITMYTHALAIDLVSLERELILIRETWVSSSVAPAASCCCRHTTHHKPSRHILDMNAARTGVQT